MKKMKKVLLTLLACSCLAATAGLAVACGDETEKPTTPTPPPAENLAKYTLGARDTTLYTSTDSVEYEVTVGASKKWYFEANAVNEESEEAEFTCAMDLGGGYTQDTTIQVNGYLDPIPVVIPANVTKVKIKVTPSAANTYLYPMISEVFEVSEEHPEVTVDYKFAAGTLNAQFYVISDDDDGTLSFAGSVASGSVTVGNRSASYASTNAGGTIFTSQPMDIYVGDMTAVNLLLDSEAATDFSMKVTFEKESGEGSEIVFIVNGTQEVPYTLGDDKSIEDLVWGLSLEFKQSGTYTITVTCSTAEGMNGFEVLINDDDAVEGTITGTQGVYVVEDVTGGTKCNIYPPQGIDETAPDTTYTVVITKI